VLLLNLQGWVSSMAKTLCRVIAKLAIFLHCCACFYYIGIPVVCRQCFDTCDWAPLGGRKGIQRVKTEWWGTGVVICQEWGANHLHMVQPMTLPPHVFLQSNPEWFNFLVTASQIVVEKRPLNTYSGSVDGMPILSIMVFKITYP